MNGPAPQVPFARSLRVKSNPVVPNYEAVLGFVGPGLRLAIARYYHDREWYVENATPPRDYLGDDWPWFAYCWKMEEGKLSDFVVAELSRSYTDFPSAFARFEENADKLGQQDNPNELWVWERLSNDDHHYQVRCTLYRHFPHGTPVWKVVESDIVLDVEE